MSNLLFGLLPLISAKWKIGRRRTLLESTLFFSMVSHMEV
uniref:Predicted protein n=1 Tax=Hordeum vulgare subsp. vulgare TaxID=112509 RepID=F2EDD2_HORVV|nr:predicted protein [Hordeum vulgare subsp. vulgare]